MDVKPAACCHAFGKIVLHRFSQEFHRVMHRLSSKRYDKAAEKVQVFRVFRA